MRKKWGLGSSDAVGGDDWQFADRYFKKRHVLAHSMGVVDGRYMKNTGDREASVGRKVSVTGQDVKLVTEIVRKLGAYLFNGLAQPANP